MPSQVTAADGDTLCGLALQSGFVNCDPLRSLPENSTFTSRPLQKGDVVTVPDPQPKDTSGATGGTTNIVVNSGSAPALRFVHGSPSLPMAQDTTLTLLEISNYVTNKAGTTQAAAFPPGIGFNADGDADPDAFKVEATLTGGGDSVTVLLEALQPVYAADGSLQGHQLFTGSEYDNRKLEVQCQRANAVSKFYRSPYLRLVTDDVDQAAAPKQTLLVTDLADGQDGAEDQVEILDQLVRASTPVPVCNAPADNQCRVRVELPVGPERRRVRLCVHVFRAQPGQPAAVGSLDETMVRRRIRKWFRRAYAQAGLAPHIVDPGIEFVDPPPADMLVLGEGTGIAASGLDASGAQSFLRFALGAPPPGAPPPDAAAPAAGSAPAPDAGGAPDAGSAPPPDAAAPAAGSAPAPDAGGAPAAGSAPPPAAPTAGGAPAPAAGAPAAGSTPPPDAALPAGSAPPLQGDPRDPIVSVPLVAGMTPRMVAAAVVGALPAGYTAQTFPNPRAFTAADSSCDVIVSKSDGTRVMIQNEFTTDTQLLLDVARVDLTNVDSATPNLIPANPDMRRILRAAVTSDDRLDYFLIDTWRTTALRGRAFVPGTDLGLPFQPTASLRWAVIMAANSSSGAVMDGGDNLPFTFPHEGGHVLNDAFHTDGANSTTEMMTGSGTSVANAVDASKRICDTVNVNYGMFDPAQPTPGAAVSVAISAVVRMRARGAPVIEDW